MSHNIYDKKGIPVRPGDLIKVYHFTGARKKKHYMYKFVWEYTIAETGKKVLMGNHLEKGLKTDGISIHNSYYMTPTGVRSDMEIVQGYNNQGDELDFNDRPRVKIKNLPKE